MNVIQEISKIAGHYYAGVDVVKYIDELRGYGMKDICVECGKREPVGSGLCLRCVCKATEGRKVKSDAAKALQVWWEEIRQTEENEKRVTA